jgi:O-antigen biosynthesis protein
MNISIVILNYNGLGYLKECLPSVIRAAQIYGKDSEVMVVDNASVDQSREYIRDNFPHVNLLALKENFSFTRAMNKGICAARNSIVIGLNNDINADEGFIAPLIRHFNQKDTFAVAAKMLFRDKGGLNFGRATPSFKYGFFIRKLEDSDCSRNSLYASGGAFAVDKQKFLKLGGFDEDISVYWEDLDLCYRAWKQGFKTIFEPESILYHKFHGTNMHTIGKRGIDLLSGENYALFIIKNFNDKNLFLRQILFFPALIALSLITGRFYFALGLLNSARRWRLFFNKRRIQKEKALFSDKQIFQWVN